MGNALKPHTRTLDPYQQICLYCHQHIEQSKEQTAKTSEYFLLTMNVLIQFSEMKLQNLTLSNYYALWERKSPTDTALGYRYRATLFIRQLFFTSHISAAKTVTPPKTLDPYQQLTKFLLQDRVKSAAFSAEEKERGQKLIENFIAHFEEMVRAHAPLMEEYTTWHYMSYLPTDCPVSLEKIRHFVTMMFSAYGRLHSLLLHNLAKAKMGIRIPDKTVHTIALLTKELGENFAEMVHLNPTLRMDYREWHETIYGREAAISYSKDKTTRFIQFNSPWYDGKDTFPTEKQMAAIIKEANIECAEIETKRKSKKHL